MKETTMKQARVKDNILLGCDCGSHHYLALNAWDEDDAEPYTLSIRDHNQSLWWALKTWWHQRCWADIVISKEDLIWLRNRIDDLMYEDTMPKEEREYYENL